MDKPKICCTNCYEDLMPCDECGVVKCRNCWNNSEVVFDDSKDKFVCPTRANIKHGSQEN